MPCKEIATFYGVRISMDAASSFPSIKADTGKATAVFSLYSGGLYGAKETFPKAKSALVTAWILLHKDELIQEFKNYRNNTY